MQLYSNELVFCTFKYQIIVHANFYFTVMYMCVCFILKFTYHFKHICNPLIAELTLLTVSARLIMQFSDDRSITGYIQPEFVDEKKVLC